MILYIKGAGTKRVIAIVLYIATDWCFWPVLVFNPAPPKIKACLLSLQWLNLGAGISWRTNIFRRK